MSINDAYCSMIHGGINLDLKGSAPEAQHCCLRADEFVVDVTQNFWHDKRFYALRELNKQGQWDPGCSNCSQLEQLHLDSFRTGTNTGLQMHGQTDLSGPARIDLMFDISCNLACRICGTHSSSFWQKHLKEHNLWDKPIAVPNSIENVINALKQLDLSNLRMLTFSGGETLLGQAYWDVAEWLANNVPDAKHQLTICFQTNGTQPIHKRNYDTIKKVHLIKLHISLDGIGDRFEYMRWPASWNQVVNNILSLRSDLPSNVMFLIEETISIFNLYYLHELEQWIHDNFTTNREGDSTNHTRHFARASVDVACCTQEYVDAMSQSPYKNLISADWKENPERIKLMIEEIKQFDRLRHESFEQTFPEVAAFYSRFL